jgi:hypothetical protein
MKRFQLFIVIALCCYVQMLFSCKKDSDQRQQEINKLGILSEERIVRINQAVSFYDSTAIVDSIDFQKPTPDKYYEWTVLPKNGCDSAIDDPVTGDLHKGIFGVIFHCPGTYRATAKIYDAAHQHFLGNTDTTEVTVVNEVLLPFQPIKPNDVLTVRPSLARAWTEPHNSDNSPPDEISIQLIFSTTEEYDYYTPYIRLDYINNNPANGFSYTFGNVQLETYPFAFGYGIKSTAVAVTDLKGLVIGRPVNLDITWLGKKYQGTITVADANHYTTNWNNDGAVRFE